VHDELKIDDLSLAVEEWGSGEPPLLLLHGFTGSRVDWADVVDDLAGDRRVIAYDQRGHGDSTNAGEAAAYTFDHLVADLTAVVDERVPGPFDLLGHSMGGIVAMRYAIAHPDRLRSLILMDTAGAPAGAIPQTWVDNVVATARAQGMGAVAEMMVGFLDRQDPPPRAEVRERILHKLTNMDAYAFAALSAELNAYPSVLDDLSRLRMPVTILVGENDTGLRAGADALAATIPGAELIIIKGAGHSPQEDDPSAWVAAVRRHLERVG
jgi:pimeloyl-ACP methyl ester carboxylesterase